MYINTIYKYITNLTGIYLLKTKQHRHQNMIQNKIKVNNKDTRTTSTRTSIPTADPKRVIVNWE